METFILKLAVAVIPLILLVASVTLISHLLFWCTHHPLAWHRRRRHIPIPNQSAIFVGSSSAPQHTGLYVFVASILTALISSLI